MYPGRLKVEISRRLADSWPDLADLLAIPPADRRRFRPGDEPREIWEWLERRGRLGDLGPALRDIGRHDLARLLPVPDDLRHWRRVLALPVDDTPGDGFFAGRAAALNHVTEWLTGVAGKPVCVVTGDPGSGKSAVLAWFALRGHRPVPAGAPVEEPPAGAIVAAVDARGLSTERVLQALTEQVGSSAATFQDLWEELDRRPGPAGVVLDSVDESENPNGLMRSAQASLRSVTRPKVRLLIGVRRPNAPARSGSVDRVDLDREFADPAALRSYVRRILETRPAFRSSAIRLDRIAAAIAGAAEQSFLVAGLSAAAAAVRGVPDPDARFPHEVGEAMRDYLDAYRVDHRTAEELLRPLAYARGAGFPIDLWSRLAGELAGRPGKVGRHRIERSLGGPLAAFVAVSRTNPAGAARSRAAYRLFHEALDEHLATAEPLSPEAVRPGTEAREAIAAALTPPSWDGLDDYLRQHLADHARGTTMLSGLMRASAFLVRADPASVLRALPQVADDELTAAQAYESVVHHLAGPVSLPERHAYLLLAARRVADTALAADWARDAPRAAWWPEAALWRRIARSRILHRQDGAVAQVAAARPLGEPVVVSTDSAGTVAISGVGEVDAESPAAIAVSGEPIEAAAVAVVDGLPLVVAGDENGALHTVDLPGAAVGGIEAAGGAGVSAVGWDAATADRIAIGRRDGSLSLRAIYPPPVPATDARAGATEVFALAAIGAERFAGASGDGRMFVWDTRAGSVTSVDETLPRTTALAGAEDAVVTGHADGSVRYWTAGAGRLRQPVVLGPDQVRRPERRTGEAPAVVAVAAARPGGRLVVLVADEEDEIAIVDVATGRSWEQGLSGHEGPVWSIAVFALGGRTLVASGGEDGTVRLWQLDDLAVPAAGRVFLAAPWSPMRLAEHLGRLLCLAIGGPADFAILDALTGETIAGPYRTGAGQDLSAAALLVESGQVRYVIGTGSGRLGIGVLGAEAAWAALPEAEWIAGVVIAGGLLFAVRADGQVNAFDLGLRRRPSRDFHVGDEKVLGARSDGPDHLVATRYSGRTDRWDLRTGSPAPPGEPPRYGGDESGWVRAGEVRLDVGASVRDVLVLTDGRLAVATGWGVALLDVSPAGRAG